MKLSVLGQTPYACRKRLQKQIAFCVAAVIVTLGLNLLFTALRTDTNHIRMLILNIAADFICGAFCVYYLTVRLIPKYRLYRLFSRKAEEFTGTVETISQAITRYMDIDCYEITAGGRRIFLPADTFSLEADRQYRFFLVSNTIVEVAL